MNHEIKTPPSAKKSGLQGLQGLQQASTRLSALPQDNFEGLHGVTNPPAATPPPPDPDAVREFYEERAAIFEYDANQPRAQAEAAALRRTVEYFHLPDPGAGGIAAVLAALAARGAEPSHPETRSPSHD